MKPVTVYTTFPNQVEATKLADMLVKKKLAACVNILSTGESVYLWKGEVQKSNEIYALIKTTEPLITKIEKVFEEFHSYETPCLMQLGDIKFNKGYFDWIISTLKQ